MELRYEQLGADVSDVEVTFRLFLPDNGKDPAQYVRGGDPRIAAVRVAGTFQDEPWDVATAPETEPVGDPSGTVWTVSIPRPAAQSVDVPFPVDGRWDELPDGAGLEVSGFRAAGVPIPSHWGRVYVNTSCVAGDAPARRGRRLPRRHRPGRRPQPRRPRRPGVCGRRARRAPLALVGFSWGGATALRVASAAPELVASLALVEPEAHALLREEDADAYGEIRGLRDRWRAHVRAGRRPEAFEEFVDFYNGPGAFSGWPPARREAFLAVQRARGDLWDVLFDEERLSVDALARLTVPVHVVEGSRTSRVDHAICAVIRRHVPHARHTLIEGAGHMMPLTHPEPLVRALLGAWTGE